MSSKKIVLHFPKKLVDRPLVCDAVKKHNLDFNILRASVTPDEEGILVLELTGAAKDLNKAIKLLRSSEVTVQPLSKDVVRNEPKCTHCGLCVVYCPTSALYTDKVTQEIIFEKDKCIGCEICVKVCPTRAMEINF
ncbi:MAG: 4Fe-4S binding protein [Candidatus Kaelpia aquatica]|nr:4Fe-4S binding protein [Candidatus Kaelpia aquatica]